MAGKCLNTLKVSADYLTSRWQVPKHAKIRRNEDTTRVQDFTNNDN